MSIYQLSFLGKGNYRETNYCFKDNGKKIQTKFFPLALAQCYPPDKIFIVVTTTIDSDKDYQKNLDELSNELKNQKLIKITVPSGKSDNELWEIFDNVTDRLIQDITESQDKNPKLNIDITHGFRTIPFIALSSVIYFRLIKDINIKAIYYGAYEARDEEKDESPVFNLYPFVELIDWLGAAKRFIDLGDSSAFATILTKIQNQQHKERQSENPSIHLKSLGKTLEELSLALNLIRISELPSCCKKLKNQIEKEETQNEIKSYAKPFGLVLDKIKEAYRFDSSEDLAQQLKLAEHYLKSNQIVQCGILLREWIVNYTSSQLIDYDANSLEDRENIEDFLNERPNKSLKFKEDFTNEKEEKIKNFWKNISQFRNDLAHCGLGRNYLSAKKLKSNITKCLEHIQKLV
ncbi:TIGR02221 family CRISPR-associated protein [Methylacidiphilum caldifontis]|uniref:CRISPR-associated protein n=1 Tax=Methylacidiphilum caldifontis TaxID=2795386 RepID=A0A4Y8P6Z1_9BACT|nr:TIGR02221 family CRISPR-associated protein [Methylacidiphilum caldifontis]TFE65865.1 CRISPR-associated protein [Methylacidiphilum caldifontis]